MDDERARQLLDEETERVRGLLRSLQADGRIEHAARDDEQESSDNAQQLTAEGYDDSLVENFERRLEALDTARRRLDDGTFGFSVQSGAPISDERLEADPAAELTIDEATAQSTD